MIFWPLLTLPWLFLCSLGTESLFSFPHPICPLKIVCSPLSGKSKTESLVLPTTLKGAEGWEIMKFDCVCVSCLQVQGARTAVWSRMGPCMSDRSGVSRSQVGHTWNPLFTVDTTCGRLSSTLWITPHYTTQGKKHTRERTEREWSGWHRPGNHDYYSGPISIFPCSVKCSMIFLQGLPHLTGHVI